jgi:molybdenum cofactor biosynthesis enzyme MoaA
MTKNKTKDYNVSMPFYEIRLSVTGACNQNCVYCGPFVDGKHSLGYGNISLELIKEFINELSDFINKQKIHIQITGGEPTLRSDLIEIFTLLNQEVEDIGMTTNGSRLDTQLVKRLINNGLSDIHVHLPSLDKDVYKKTTRASFDKNRLKNTLDSALYMNSIKKRVEFNTPVTDLNVDTLPELLNFCYENKINLKLIEELRLDNLPYINIDKIKKILLDWINSRNIATIETSIKNRYGIIYQFDDDFFFRIAPVNKQFKANLIDEPQKILLDGRYWVGAINNSFLFTPSYSISPQKGTIKDLKEQIEAVFQEYKKIYN